jgi:fructan beta-fructosidase
MSSRQASILTVAAVLAALGGSVAANAQNATTFQEPYRPQFHFTPEKNWMNDPNGLVSYQGEHHMFYQYNPFGNVWDFTISWGHAVSRDMVHWQELPVAIPATDTVSIFSGSAVVDRKNTSGFGTFGKPPLVAIYTVFFRKDAVDPKDGSVIPQGTQAQSIAYSTDNGRTWTPYQNNPVINPWKDASINPREFRDPKVFWYEPTRRWIMVVALSLQHQIRFYSSTNLKDWTFLSDFGPANAIGGVWEVPDLFELAVDERPQDGHSGFGFTDAVDRFDFTDTVNRVSEVIDLLRARDDDHKLNQRNKKWVLVGNLNPGAVASGSGAQYFIGKFDGKQFTAENVIDNSPPPGVVFQDFETGNTFADLSWVATGDFAGKGPASGSLPGQGPVLNFHGAKFVNTFFNFDAGQGTITSPTFAINRKYINLLVGGGNHPHDPNTTDAPPPAGDLLFPGADLEPAVPGSTTYEQLLWTATGGLVNQPVPTGAIGGQQPISGFQGKGLINTFTNASDQAQGTLTSSTFTIQRPYINFLVGGGSHAYPGDGPTAVLLEVNGKVVRSASGQDNESLNWVAWNVSEFIGQTADIKIVDANSGGWGHINADQFMASTAPALPVSTETTVNLIVDGKVVRSGTGQNSDQLTWTAWNVGEFAGRNAQIQVIDKNTGGWGHILVDDIVFSDVPKEVANWVDRGRDFYAVVSWNNLPDDQRRWIAWMNNWQYGGQIPTSPWRSAQSIPREVGLMTFEDGVHLIQQPIPELRELRGHPDYDANQVTINEGTTVLTGKGAQGKALEIVAEFETGSASEFGIKVRKGSGEETLVGYNVPAGEIFVDRTQSGEASFSNLFTNNGMSYPSRETAPVPAKNGRVKLHIFVDWSSVEVFADYGRAVITDQIFPNPASDGLALFAKGGSAKLVSLEVWPLRSIWNKQ